MSTKKERITSSNKSCDIDIIFFDKKSYDINDDGKKHN